MGNKSTDLYDAISNSAIINICKHSGGPKSSDNYILEQGKKNSMIIRQQIDELTPEVIVAGSDVVWRCLSNPTWGICKDMICGSVKRHECKRFGTTIFYHANHPSAWTGGGFDVVKIQRQIFETLKAVENNTI